MWDPHLEITWDLRVNGGLYRGPHLEITWDLRVNGGLYRGPPPRDNVGLKG